VKFHLGQGEPKPPIDFEGSRYICGYEASKRTGISASTLERWASKGVTRHGWPLRAVRKDYEVFLDEKCINDIEERRFCAVPGDKPVGRITLGFAPDQSGYLSGSDAASILSITTSYLITCCRRAAQGKPVRGFEGLEIVRDLLESNKQYYLSERSVRAAISARRAVMKIPSID